MGIVVSGANGFIGRAVSAAMADAGHDVTALVRRTGGCEPRARELLIPDDDFASLAAGNPPLGRCDVLVHLAARVHVMHDDATDPLADYRAANVQGTLNVAAAALQAGVRRIVFVSSVKALGETEPGRPWREDDRPMPTDPYGMSKLEAEAAITAFGRRHGVEVVVLRPPLVYGPGVRANFLSLLKAVERGIPLPFGTIDARRSMVYVGNLADAIRCVATWPGPLDGVFHVTDGEDLTVSETIRTMAHALGRSARLLPVPVSWLRALGTITGRTAQIERLTSPLRLDSARLTQELGWKPPSTVAAGLAETVRAFTARR
jgi:UDP-glucose 4-epimerase